MEPKAYDLKLLAEKLKSKGLPVVEETAAQAYEAVKEWVQESASITPTPIDDLAVQLFPAIDKLVLPQIDKIDGQDNR